MAPSTSQPLFAKDEKILCFHHSLLYDAKVLDSKAVDPNDKKSAYQYKVHYKGWKNTWDDWVPEERLRKLTDENKELAATLKKEVTAANRPVQKAASISQKKRQQFGSDLSSARGSEERQSNAQAQLGGSRGVKRGRDYDNQIEKEDPFLSRPSIRIPIPDDLKALLVDDWEKVTKNLQLVPLPAALPANTILDEYLEYEKQHRRPGSATYDILEEVVAGMKEYFERSLGRILLYKFERQQFQETYKRMTAEGAAAEGGLMGKTVGDVYGVEHLSRLFVTMPELVAHTNMDKQAVSRLREELAKMTQWLARNKERFFTAEYQNASQEYIDRAKGIL